MLNVEQLSDYLNNKIVVWSLQALQLATALLSLFGKEGLRLLLALARGLVSWAQWPLNYYQLGKEIAARVQLLLELTASDSGGGRGGAGGGGAQRLTAHAYREAPEPVRSYLKYALREGQPSVKCLLIKQAGYFRFLPTAVAAGGVPPAAPVAAGGGAAGAEAAKDWKKLSGEAYVSVNRPGLVWSATIQLSPLTWVRGFAGYLRGRGSTRWKRVSLFRGVEDVEGERALGTVALLRFLAEAPCYPMALVPSSYLRWEAIDKTSARAVITDAGLTASAVFRFNALGHIVGMRTTDARSSAGAGASSSGGGGVEAGDLVCYYRHYAVMGGHHPMRVPTEVEAAWELPGGEYSYAQLEIRDVVCWDSMEMPHHEQEF